jgi:hypothetical protein
MGVVYEAEQISVPGRKVAVKVLLGFGGSQTARQRFAREVEVAGQLDHPHIVPILCADVASAHPFYAMKKIDGRSLRLLLQEGELQNDCRRTATMIRDLARALHHAHEHGVVHRDVKPGNVVVDGEGRAMLLDFGLAHVLQSDSDLTRSLDAIGTLDYMAPEQIGRQFGPITAKTDVYSLGVTLFECLTGHAPFAAESRTAVLERIVRGDAVRLRSLAPVVPRDLENVCAMAMQAEPKRRYASAAAFAADLDAFLDFRPVAARPPGFVRRGVVLARRHRLATAAAVAALASFVVAGGYWAWWQPMRAADTRLAQIDSLAARCAKLDERITADTAAMVAQRQAARRPGIDPELAALQRERRRSCAERNQLHGELEAALEACLEVDPGHDRTNRVFADFVAGQLRAALQGGGIVTRRDQIERHQLRLHRLDSEGRHAGLLDQRGSLSLRCARGPARVWLCPAAEQADGRMLYVASDDAAARDLGTTPIDIDATEGNYALRATVDGCEELVLPILLRRRAVQSPAERDLGLQPQTAAEIGAGYRQVHGGFSVVVTDRADPVAQRDDLQWVDGFVMAEHEVRVEDVVAWFGEVPAFLAKAHNGHLLAGPKWPQITELVHQLNLREQQQATGCCVALPTPEQWARAGQGADGRPYPWGWLHGWKFTQNYWSSVDRSMALLATTWPEEDVSPFGIHELAGSMREVCLPMSPMRELGNKQFLLYGGSHYSFRAEDLMLWSSRSLMYDELAVDIGLRLVRRPLPAVPAGPATLRLDGGGADSAVSMCAGWHLSAISGPFVEDLTTSDRSRAEPGQLVLDGFAGSFSPNLMLWHAIDAGSDRTHAAITLSLRHGDELTRPVELRLGTQPGLETHDRWVACQLMRERMALATGAGGQTTAAPRPLPGMQRDTTFRIEVATGPHTLMVKWCQDGGDAIELQIERPANLPDRWRYVGVRLPNFIGVEVHLHDLVVDGG